MISCEIVKRLSCDESRAVERRITVSLERRFYPVREREKPTVCTYN